MRALRNQAPHLERVAIRVLSPIPTPRQHEVSRETGRRRRIPLASIEDEALRALLKR